MLWCCGVVMLWGWDIIIRKRECRMNETRTRCLTYNRRFPRAKSSHSEPIRRILQAHTDPPHHKGMSERGCLLKGLGKRDTEGGGKSEAMRSSVNRVKGSFTSLTWSRPEGEKKPAGTGLQTASIKQKPSSEHGHEVEPTERLVEQARQSDTPGGEK